MAYPFPQDKLPATLAEWQQIPAMHWATATLTPTQYYIRIDRILALADGRPPELLDVPHLVCFEGKTYLFDGHHRWTLAMIHGEEFILARCFVL